MHDVRTNLPAGVNAADMRSSGERSGPLSQYGPWGTAEVAKATIGRVFDAWGVTDYHLLNPVDATGRAPLPGTQGGPRYMLKFPDGMWRYASFCGISGPPWFRCEWQPWAGKDGRHAELRRDRFFAQKHVDTALARLEDARRDLDAIEAILKEEHGDC